MRWFTKSGGQSLERIHGFFPTSLSSRVDPEQNRRHHHSPRRSLATGNLQRPVEQDDRGPNNLAADKDLEVVGGSGPLLFSATACTTGRDHPDVVPSFQIQCLYFGLSPIISATSKLHHILLVSSSGLQL
jgi:hypothetical protein